MCGVNAEFHRRSVALAALGTEWHLRPDKAHAVAATALRDGGVNATGTAITKVLPPLSRCSPDGSHGEEKQRLAAILSDCFNGDYGLG